MPSHSEVAQAGADLGQVFFFFAKRVSDRVVSVETRSAESPPMSCRRRPGGGAQVRIYTFIFTFTFILEKRLA